MELRRPLGLALDGGGAHGAWQTGMVQALSEDFVLVFDRVLGVSAGSLTGTALFLDRLDEIVDRWRKVNGERVLRFAPRINPPSLFSGQSLRDALRTVKDDEHARRTGRGHLTVVSISKTTGKRVYARFSAGGEPDWDGPLATHVIASCSIPYVFPPVDALYQGEPVRLMDGGASCKDPIHFHDLAGCRDVLVLDLSPPPEAPRGKALLDRVLGGAGIAEAGLMSQGIASLKALVEPPRIFHVRPSEPLAYSYLDFRERYCGPALEQGRTDARLLLDRLEDYRV